MNAIRHRLAALAASVLIVSGLAASAHAADVVIVSPGGLTQEASKKALWDPAAKALGWTVERDTSESWTEAKAQVDAGAVSWDIISLNMGEVQLAVDAGTIIKLPSDIVDRADFIPGSVNDYCVGNSVYSTVVAYNTKKYGDGAITSIQDFWDVKKFPGKRGLYRSPRGNIEAAVIALGHKPSEVYDFLSTDEGKKAAFDKIAELKPYAIWWESGAQATQLTKDGEVDMIYGFNGRLQAAIDAGAPFKINYKDGLLENDCYAVVKGAPHTDNAIKFVKEISKPEYVKDFPKYIAYGGANLKAYATYDEKTLSRLTSSPQNAKLQYPANVDFWGKNGTALSEQFDNMLLAK
ncbi:ABC transporter substrate-binding protein [Rhizobium rhizogenes]|uniref:ABC transporter substrate-binding protein n=1 Tax=Rhizobium rhizogenes TaxID=359 RepID=UPI001573CDBB|nr:ABC transporter substrate-binding protein [Rhizobium rhizogenes]NTF72682.1 ABC transporter substrate-binding protein [Rhizobium rhizogenes]